MTESLDALSPLARLGWGVTNTPHQVEFGGSQCSVSIIEYGRRISCEIGLAKPLTAADASQGCKEMALALGLAKLVFPGIAALCTVLTELKSN